MCCLSLCPSCVSAELLPFLNINEMTVLYFKEVHWVHYAFSALFLFVCGCLSVFVMPFVNKIE